MSPEFNEDRQKVEARIAKEIESFIAKYDSIKGLKVETTMNVQSTKMQNFIDVKVGLRIEI